MKNCSINLFVDHTCSLCRLRYCFDVIVCASFLVFIECHRCHIGVFCFNVNLLVIAAVFSILDEAIVQQIVAKKCSPIVALLKSCMNSPFVLSTWLVLKEGMSDVQFLKYKSICRGSCYLNSKLDQILKKQNTN